MDWLEATITAAANERGLDFMDPAVRAQLRAELSPPRSWELRRPFELMLAPLQRALARSGRPALRAPRLRGRPPGGPPGRRRPRLGAGDRELSPLRAVRHSALRPPVSRTALGHTSYCGTTAVCQSS